MKMKRILSEMHGIYKGLRFPATRKNILPMHTRNHSFDYTTSNSTYIHDS